MFFMVCYFIIVVMILQAHHHQRGKLKCRSWMKIVTEWSFHWQMYSKYMHMHTHICRQLNLCPLCNTRGYNITCIWLHFLDFQHHCCLLLFFYIHPKSIQCLDWPISLFLAKWAGTPLCQYILLQWSFYGLPISNCKQVRNYGNTCISVELRR